MMPVSSSVDQIVAGIFVTFIGIYSYRIGGEGD
jgi:hypothetical protein